MRDFLGIAWKSKWLSVSIKNFLYIYLLESSARQGGVGSFQSNHSKSKMFVEMTWCKK